MNALKSGLTLQTQPDTRLALVREAWVRDVKDLVHTVEEWAEGAAAERGWTTTKADIELSEEATGGSYVVPILEIHAPEGKLVLEPVGRGTMNADGRVDLYAWPSLYRVMLLRKNDQGWIVRTDSGLDWPESWGDDTFMSLAGGLLKAL